MLVLLSRSLEIEARPVSVAGVPGLTPGTPVSFGWAGNRGTGTDYNAVDEYKAGNGYIYDKLGNVEHKPDDSSSERWNYYYSGDNLMNSVRCFGEPFPRNRTCIDYKHAKRHEQ